MDKSKGNRAFMAKRIAFSLGVILLAVVALTAIWNPDDFASIREFIKAVFNWILSLLVLLLTVIFIACFWRSPLRVGAKHPDPNEGGETDHPKLPYPVPYKKNSISEFRYSSDLRLMRLKERLPEIGPEKQEVVPKIRTGL